LLFWYKFKSNGSRHGCPEKAVGIRTISKCHICWGCHNISDGFKEYKKKSERIHCLLPLARKKSDLKFILKNQLNRYLWFAYCEPQIWRKSTFLCCVYSKWTKIRNNHWMLVLTTVKLIKNLFSMDNYSIKASQSYEKLKNLL